MRKDTQAFINAFNGKKYTFSIDNTQLDDDYSRDLRIDLEKLWLKLLPDRYEFISHTPLILHYTSPVNHGNVVIWYVREKKIFWSLDISLLIYLEWIAWRLYYKFSAKDYTPVELDTIASYMDFHAKDFVYRNAYYRDAFKEKFWSDFKWYEHNNILTTFIAPDFFQNEDIVTGKKLNAELLKWTFSDVKYKFVDRYTGKVELYDIRELEQYISYDEYLAFLNKYHNDFYKKYNYILMPE